MQVKNKAKERNRKEWNQNCKEIEPKKWKGKAKKRNGKRKKQTAKGKEREPKERNEMCVLFIFACARKDRTQKMKCSNKLCPGQGQEADQPLDSEREG